MPHKYNANRHHRIPSTRYKVMNCQRLIGNTLRSYAQPAQEVETRIAVSILNRMLDLGHPASVRAA
jgi:hypothetical protein